MQDTDPTSPSPCSQQQCLAAWIRLAHTPGVGRVTVLRLLEHFQTPQAIFSAPPAQLAPFVSPAGRCALASDPPDFARTLDTVLGWLAQSCNHVLTMHDPAYPPLLREIADPPILLYAIGQVALLSRPAIAVVGSRNATAQGAANATHFAHALSAAGLGIVSGLALGIDAAAHEGGLRGSGSSIAVIGTGADRNYPRANHPLAKRIASEGCIVSEYSLGTPPSSANFPRRNRIISGLSCAVLVVEAAAGSGSLITAKVAAEQGRDVFAIPGSIHAPLAKGCHKLIKEGAKLVECAADLLDELQLSPLARITPPTARACDAAHQELLEKIGYDPVDTDTLVTLTAAAPGVLAAQLLSLELSGHVERLPGGLFQRINR